MEGFENILEATGLKLVDENEINGQQPTGEGQDDGAGDAGTGVGQDSNEGQGDGQQQTDMPDGGQDNAQQSADENRVIYTPEDPNSSDGQGAGYSGQGGDEPSPEEITQFVNSYLTETIGVSLEDLQERLERPAVDERIRPILDFIEKTGRDPQDWFMYQQTDPAKMDNAAVLRMQMLSENPDMLPEDAQMLVENRYKLDDELIDDRERKLLDLQMRMDANKARKEISSLRESYAAPIKKETQRQTTPEVQKIANDNWIQEAQSEIESLEGIDFEIGDKTFTFGLNQSTKGLLRSKSAQVDAYMDQYIAADGTWNHELFNTHQVVLNSIDEIVGAVYKQGISDGQRNVVQEAANVGTTAPRTGGGPAVSGLEQQLAKILGSNNQMMTIKV